MKRKIIFLVTIMMILSTSSFAIGQDSAIGTGSQVSNFYIV